MNADYWENIRLLLVSVCAGGFPILIGILFYIFVVKK